MDHAAKTPGRTLIPVFSTKPGSPAFSLTMSSLMSHQEISFHLRFASQFLLLATKDLK